MTDFAGSNTPADQRDLWRTPPAIFFALDAEFCFQLDAAAAPHNALCRKFITAEQNTLETPWADYLSIPGYVWMSPAIQRYHAVREEGCSRERQSDRYGHAGPSRHFSWLV